MRKKLLLGFLVLALAFSMILFGCLNLSGANLDNDEETLNSSEPTQTDPEQTESETAEPEPTETEPTETEPTETEPTTTEPTQQEPEPTETEPTQTTFPVQTNYSIPVANAIKFFAYSEQPEAMLWLDVMHRRFGIGEFSNSLQRFDYLLWHSSQSTVLNLFRRIADYNCLISEVDLISVKNELDLITIPALYCDRMELSPNYVNTFKEGVSSGGYPLTHALLAWIWIQENGCNLNLPDGFIEDMYQANAALINTDSVVTDLELEAAAFLYLAGQGDLVDDAFLDCVLESQCDDGGWESGMRWHTTILGLLYLLHVEFPSDSYPPVLAPEAA